MLKESQKLNFHFFLKVLQPKFCTFVFLLDPPQYIFKKNDKSLMEVANLLDRALRFESLTAQEGVFLFENAPTTELMYVANRLRQIQVPNNKVTWIIDRN